VGVIHDPTADLRIAALYLIFTKASHFYSHSPFHLRV